MYMRTHKQVPLPDLMRIQVANALGTNNNAYVKTKTYGEIQKRGTAAGNGPVPIVHASAPLRPVTQANASVRVLVPRSLL